MWPFTTPTSSASSSTLPSTSKNTSQGVDKCPVDHTTRSTWLSTSNPPPHPLPASGPSSADSCPVDHETRSVWLANATPSSSSSAPHPLHQPLVTSPASYRPRDATNLPTERVTSSIPRGSLPSSSSSSSTSQPPLPPPSCEPSQETTTPTFTSLPPAEPEEKWVYPSELQFFQAMLRKNHNPKAEDMATIVPIHNAVNEKAWEEVMKWEKGLGGEKCGGVKLVSFIGRPRDRTPKAVLKMALGYNAPFDRHDWTITRCGKQVRYVIDFYTGRTDAQNRTSLAFHLDVRPALDNWEGVRTRVLGMFGQ